MTALESTRRLVIRLTRIEDEATNLPGKRMTLRKQTRKGSSEYMQKEASDPSPVYTCNVCDMKFDKVMALRSHARVHSNVRSFNCEHCDRSFTLEHHLRQHVAKHGLPVVEDECPYCNKRFISRKTLDLHVRTHTGMKEVCKHCKLGFKSMAILRAHVRVSHPEFFEFEVTAKCDKCDAVLAKSSLVEHMKRKHSVTARVKVPCHLCDKSFVGKREQRLHEIRIHSDLRPFNCPMCPRAFKSNGEVKAHILSTHTLEKPHSCEQCASSFINSGSLKSHVENIHTHPGRKRVKCDQCGKTLSNKTVLLLHIRSKHGKDPELTCSYCKKTSYNKKALSDHIERLHTRPDHRPFPCEFCDWAFKSKGERKNHLRSAHLSERTYICSTCGFAAKTSGTLHAHIENRHAKGSNVVCEQCPKTFPSKSRLQLHVTRHHGQKIICPICQMQLVTAWSLKEHIARVHESLRPHSCSFCSATFRELYELEAHVSKHTGENNRHCSECQRDFTSIKMFKIHLRQCGVNKLKPQPKNTNAE